MDGFVDDFYRYDLQQTKTVMRKNQITIVTYFLKLVETMKKMT